MTDTIQCLEIGVVLQSALCVTASIDTKIAHKILESHGEIGGSSGLELERTPANLKKGIKQLIQVESTLEDFLHPSLTNLEDVRLTLSGFYCKWGDNRNAYQVYDKIMKNWYCWHMLISTCEPEIGKFHVKAAQLTTVLDERNYHWTQALNIFKNCYGLHHQSTRLSQQNFDQLTA